jgi:hypothetical protein
MLGIIILLVLAVAMAYGKSSKPFGAFSPYIETVAYPMTFFFCLIPGIAETATRLPAEHSPGKQILMTLVFKNSWHLFYIGADWQVIKWRVKLKTGR